MCGCMMEVGSTVVDKCWGAGWWLVAVGSRENPGGLMLVWGVE